MERIPVVTYRYPVPYSARDYYISPQVETLFGYPPAAWAKPGFWESVLHPDDHERSFIASERSIETGEPFIDEYRLRASDGHWVWIRDEATLTVGSGDAKAYWQGVWVDISDLRRSQEALRQSLQIQEDLNEERRRLLTRLVAAQEEERQRLARDIHDDPIQTMAAAAFLVDHLRRLHDEPEHREALQQTARTLQEAIGRLRGLLFELLPPALEREGLASAIRQYAERITRHSDLTVHIESRVQLELPLHLRTTAYRIAQEALSNVRKHASATRADVTLDPGDGGLFASVADNGCGFVVGEILSDPQPGHLGLQAMQERAEAVGGWCRIESGPSRGSRVEYWIPAGRPEPSLA